MTRQHEPGCDYQQWNTDRGMKVARPPACTCRDVLRAERDEGRRLLERALPKVLDSGYIRDSDHSQQLADDIRSHLFKNGE